MKRSLPPSERNAMTSMQGKSLCPQPSSESENKTIDSNDVLSKLRGKQD